MVRYEDLVETVSVGPDREPHARNLGRWLGAGFTDVCIVQVGSESERFFDLWERGFFPMVAATEIEGVTAPASRA